MRAMRGTAMLVFFALGCAGGPHGWDARVLEAHYPALAKQPGHRLVESPPYFAPGPGGVALFLCRWTTREPIPVWLPATATPTEAAVLERALSAWEGAQLGVRFRVRRWRDTPPLAGIVFELLDASAADGPAGTASTVADCAIPPEVARNPPEGPAAPVDAELQYASIHLRRSIADLIDRPVPLSETELLGAALHELGHALGFPGHVARGDSVMSAHLQIESARRWGRRIEAGRAFEAPTLAALYAVPSGARVRWLPLARSQVAAFAKLSGLASGAGLRGPWVRVGSQSARLFYRDEEGESYAAVVLDWLGAQHEPAGFQARLNRRSRRLVDPARRR